MAGVWLGNDDGTPTRKTTGGSLPVEVWSRFMKTAHQGVAVAGLPGLGGSRDVAGFAPPAPVTSAPAPSRTADATRVPVADRSGIDGWLMDRLFGKH